MSKLKKKEKKNQVEEGTKKRPASGSAPPPLTRVRGKQEQKRQNDQEEEEKQEVQEPRSKIRSRYVSEAYHKKFDSLKPKLKGGYVRDTQAWNDRMELAKAKAREACSSCPIRQGEPEGGTTPTKEEED